MFCVVLFCFAKGLAKAEYELVDKNTLCDVLNMFLPPFVLCLTLIVVISSHWVTIGVLDGYGCVFGLNELKTKNWSRVLVWVGILIGLGNLVELGVFIFLSFGRIGDILRVMLALGILVKLGNVPFWKVLLELKLLLRNFPKWTSLF